ncbi:MAG: GntR family transcriptional regulator [Desulfobacterales bacterium]
MTVRSKTRSGPTETGGPGSRSDSKVISEAASQPLAQRVAARIRVMIIQDQLIPGEWIREQALADKLKVSRTPLREALKMLELEGLIRLLPNRGAVVTELTVEEVKDKLEVLAALEALAGKLACQKATDAELAEIRALHYEMLAWFSRQNRLEYFKLNQRIHLAIVAASGNHTLIETHARINAQLYRIRYQSNLQNELWGTAVEEHEEMLAALTARNGVALSKCMLNHFGQTFFKFSKNLEIIEKSRE